MQRLWHLGILREGFSAYSSQVIIISRKLTKDERGLSDFRHITTRKNKNQFGFSFGKGYIFNINVTLGNIHH